MPAPGILTGSNSVNSLFSTGGDGATRMGVFGRNPGSTPKYAVNRGPQDAEYRDSLSRLFIELPSDATAFWASLSPEVTPLARVLATGSSTGGGGGTGYIDFLMTGAQESFAEKAQIVDTLTDNYVAFYSGQAPPLFNYSGTLLNTYQDDQRVWMFRIYREILRGTRLAGRNLIARLRYDSFIVSGYLEALDQSISGDTDHQAGQFRFSMRVKHMMVFTPAIGMPTVASTPATTTALTPSSLPVDPATARVAAITPDAPPTATTGPSADSTAPILSPEQREALLAAGYTGEEVARIEGVAASLRTSSPDTDPREIAARVADAAAARMQEQINPVSGSLSSTSTTSSTTTTDTASVAQATVNPESSQLDGLGGITNGRGDVSGTVFGTSSTVGATFVQELPERESLRRRGGLTPDYGTTV